MANFACREFTFHLVCYKTVIEASGLLQSTLERISTSICESLIKGFLSWHFRLLK